MNCIYSIVAWLKKNSYILLEEKNNSVMFFLNSKVQFKMADHEILQEILDTILDFVLRKHGTQRHFIPWGFSTFNWLPNLSRQIFAELARYCGWILDKSSWICESCFNWFAVERKKREWRTAVKLFEISLPPFWF